MLYQLMEKKKKNTFENHAVKKTNNSLEYILLFDKDFLNEQHHTQISALRR